jgi:hypothetical protein
VDDSQPATRGPDAGGRPAPPPPKQPLAEPARPVVEPAEPAGQPPVDLYVGFLEFSKRFLAVSKRSIKAVRHVRQVRLFRTSSALVRWIALVVAIGFGAALLIALTINLLVSLVPSSGG